MSEITDKAEKEVFDKLTIELFPFKEYIKSKMDI